MYIVFIAGASASGKSRFSNNLLEKLREHALNSIVIKMDDYYNEIPVGRNLDEYKKTTNFDSPNSLDLVLLKEHINVLKNGKCVDKPVFDFKTERRIRTESIAPPEILLIEGTSSILFHRDFFVDNMNTLKVFIEADRETLIERRVERDMIERGYADKESILQKDAHFVWPSYRALIEPTKHLADIIVDNNARCDPSNKTHPLVEMPLKLAAELKEKVLNKQAKCRASL